MDAILLIIRGKLVLELESGKQIPIDLGIPINEDWDGMDIYEDEYKLVNNQVVSIKIHGKTYMPKSTQNQDRNQGNNNRNQGSQIAQEKRNVGFAPYNFIPINQTVVSSDNIGINNAIYEGNSGYIVLEILTQTPTFIRGRGDKSTQTLEINGKPIIAGSSLRGMTRTMVEICTWSKMDIINDQRLYFRGIAEPVSDIGKNNLKNDYADYLGQFGANVKGGYLSFNENDKTYTITPALNQGNLSKITYKGNHLKADIYLVANGAEFHSVFNNKKWDRKISLIDASASKINLSKEDIENYKNDYEKTHSSRNEKHKVPNIIALIKDNKYKGSVPVLYVEYTDIHGAKKYVFGHTLNMRVPYQSTTKDHLPEAHFSEMLDFATTIFGTTEQSSKVFFEDAIWKSGTENPIILPKAKHKMLASPKPTAFQMYLAQKASFSSQFKKMIFERSETLENWNAEANIRGYKRYWHRNTAQGIHFWKRNEANANANMEQSEIECINIGQTFISHIRFDNLSDTELGALIFALELPEKNHCHKIGLGKPLGLGSIKVKTKLVITNRLNRYKTLLTDTGDWNTSESQKETTTYKAVFEKYMLTQLNESKSSLWNVDRLVQLKAMLEYDSVKHASEDWLEKTRYMQIDTSNNEYKNRPVLPKPDEIKPQ